METGPAVQQSSVDFVPGAAEYAVEQAGPRNLWDETEAAHRWWDGHGQPGRDQFGVSVGPDGQQVWLGSPGDRVILPTP